MNKLDQDYWANRYDKGQTGWDAGSITTPIKEYVDQLDHKDLKILVPGAGNAHEAIYLHQLGFNNVYVCDWAEHPLLELKKKAEDFPNNQLLHSDFFQLEEMDFDLIIEQTFFCALSVDLRNQYVQKMHQLLKKGGKLVGLLFNFPLTNQGPPFGGSLEEYQSRFLKVFTTVEIENAHNSIKPRAGKEFFVRMIK